MFRTRGVFLLVFLGLVLFSCARPRMEFPSPPEADSLSSLVRFHLVSPKGRLSGKAVLLVRPGELYAEAFSPFGGLLFRFWFARGLVVWEESGGLVQALRFRDLSPALAEAMPYLLLGRWPKETFLESGRGYHLKSTGKGWQVTYYQRILLELFPGPQRILLRIPLLRTEIKLEIREIRPGVQEIPPVPEGSPRTVDLRSFLVPKGD